MKKTVAALMLSLIIPAVAACSNSEAAGGNISPGMPVQSVSPEVAKQPHEQPSASAGQTEERQSAPVERPDDTIAALKQEEILGLTSDELSAKYGKPQAVTDVNNYLIMRYDFPEEGYQYTEKVISVDVKGLTGKNMRSQLIVD